MDGQLMLNFNETQNENLKRVKSKTAVAILQFFDTLEVGSKFHAQELRDFVAKLVPVAPASPDRILRDMRQREELNYELVSRSQSLYRKVKCS